MKKLFVLFAVVGMSFAQIGCGAPKDDAAAPVETPAATTGDEAVEVDETVVEEPAAETTPEDAEAEN